MVHSDADGCVILFADVEERHEPVTNFLQLCCILLVGVLQLLEGACCIHIVAWVDAHFLHVLCRNVGHFGIEVYVGY